MHRDLTAVLLLALCAPAFAQEPRAQSQPASYAFATELGSGVYEVEGRTMQIYRLPFKRVLRPSDADTVGVRLTLPVTLGFFDFSPRDIVSSGLPSRLDSFAFVPGVELEFALRGNWRLLPYIRGGGTFASSDLDAALFGTGLRSEYEHGEERWTMRVVTDLAYAGANFRSDSASDDDFVRLRNGIEMKRGTGVRLRGREIEASLYWILDLYTDPPRPPLPGTRTSTVQLEPGLVLGLRPPWRVKRVPMPRLGIGYRFAGDLSGWHIVVGSPF